MRKIAIAAFGALALLGFVLGGNAADEKGAKASPQVEMKVITENDKLKVYEATYKPGAENNAVASSATRVVRCLEGGQLTRSYADGKKQVVEWKPGMVEVIQPTGAYNTKNTGKTTIHLYVVQLK